MHKTIINEVLLIPSTVLEQAKELGVSIKTPDELHKYLSDLGHDDLATIAYQSSLLITEANLPIKTIIGSNWFSDVPLAVQQTYEHLVSSNPQIKHPKTYDPNTYNNVWLSGTSLIILADEHIYTKTEEHVNLYRMIIRNLENSHLRSVMSPYISLKSEYMLCLTVLDQLV